METFIDKCLRDEISPSELDDHVEQWHKSTVDQSLQTFLGMTREEYGVWLEKPDTLLSILNAHRTVKASN